MTEQTDLWQVVERHIEELCTAAGALAPNQPTIDLLVEKRHSVLAALRQLQERYAGECVWTKDGITWHTGCGSEMWWTDFGKPFSILKPFCPYCGKPIREAEGE